MLFAAGAPGDNSVPPWLGLRAGRTIILRRTFFRDAMVCSIEVLDLWERGKGRYKGAFVW
jgi:hypothetical protein